ncbi:hypothetical protein [Microbacterium halophytorum]|uniref:hypothetical protein n=1 Tax=Microbacterium halophytorum TaxID=2067568 RepID=UPI001E628436|nr:hypothetical protein [Microbacterium halophytorum]
MAKWGRVRRPAPRERPARHGRHGRVHRSPAVRPPLPPIDTRFERFDLVLGSTVEYLRGAWPELDEVSFEIGTIPPAVVDGAVPRWQILRDEKRIVFYRTAVERFERLDRADPFQRRIIIEGNVFRAVGEYLGREPWDLGPSQF